MEMDISLQFNTKRNTKRKGYFDEGADDESIDFTI
jgi:hypothetical protein